MDTIKINFYTMENKKKLLGSILCDSAIFNELEAKAKEQQLNVEEYIIKILESTKSPRQTISNNLKKIETIIDDKDADEENKNNEIKLAVNQIRIAVEKIY